MDSPNTTSDQRPTPKMNRWLFWSPLLAAIAMMVVLIDLLRPYGFAMYAIASDSAGFLSLGIAAAFVSSYSYYRFSRRPKPYTLNQSIAKSIYAVLLVLILGILIDAFWVVPFRGHKERVYDRALAQSLHALEVPVMNYLCEHPEGVINREDQLRSEGWNPSPEVSFKSANVTAKGGVIVLKHRWLTWSAAGLQPGEGSLKIYGEECDGRIKIDGEKFEVLTPNWRH